VPVSLLVKLEKLQEKLLDLTSENMPSKQVVDWLSMLLTLLSEENLVLTNKRNSLDMLETQLEKSGLLPGSQSEILGEVIA